MLAGLIDVLKWLNHLRRHSFAEYQPQGTHLQ